MVRPTGPHLAVVTFLAALAGYVFVFAPNLAQRVDASAVSDSIDSIEAGVTKDKNGQPVPPPLFPPAGTKFIGLTTREGAYDFKPVDAFQKATQHQPSVMMFNVGWAVHKFDRSSFDKIAKRGMMPMLSWEPWDYREDNTDKNGTHADQPEFQLSKITDGDFDGYIKSYAQGIKDLKYEVAVRLAHEMNGFWYPWGINVNGNKPGDYVKMWRHVREVFTAAGVTNVTWVWSANVNFGNKIKLSSLYPGDDEVDWIGLSGYYGTAGTENYRTPGNIFDTTLKELKTFSHRPIVLTETAATNVAGYKARWVGELFRYLAKHPEIIGFIWYEAVKETDWRIVTSADAAHAFALGAASQIYQVPWSGNMLPNTALPASAESPSASPSPSDKPSKTATKTPTTEPTTRTPTTKPTTRTPTTKPTTKTPTTKTPTTKPTTKTPTTPPTTAPAA